MKILNGGSVISAKESSVGIMKYKRKLFKSKSRSQGINSLLEEADVSIL